MCTVAFIYSYEYYEYKDTFVTHCGNRGIAQHKFALIDHKSIVCRLH